MILGQNGNLKSLVRVRLTQKTFDPANYTVILFLIKGKFIFEKNKMKRFFILLIKGRIQKSDQGSADCSKGTTADSAQSVEVWVGQAFKYFLSSGCINLWKSMAKYFWKSGMSHMSHMIWQISTVFWIKRSILYEKPEEFVQRREFPVPKSSKTHLKYTLRSPKVS